MGKACVERVNTTCALPSSSGRPGYWAARRPARPAALSPLRLQRAAQGSGLGGKALKVLKGLEYEPYCRFAVPGTVCLHAYADNSQS